MTKFVFLYILTSNLITCMTHALTFHTESNVNPRITPFIPNEIIDITESWFQETIKNSIPIYEGFKEIGGNEPFVLRNYSSVDMLNPSNEYYDPIAASIINNRKLNKKHNVSTVMEDLYHVGSQQDIKIPLIGDKNDIHTGYWFSGDKKWFTPMHIDMGDVFNILACDSGKKIIFLWDPSKKEKLDLQGTGTRTIIPYKFHNITDKKYSYISKIKRYVVVLTNKDILYLPKNYVHTVYSWEKTFCRSHWILKEKFEAEYKYKKTTFIEMSFSKLKSEFSNKEINSCRNELMNKQTPNFLAEMANGDSKKDLWWFQHSDEIATALWSNQIVEISNAFENPSRFDLDMYEHWESQPSSNEVDFHRHILKNTVESRRLIQELNKYKMFFEDIILNEMIISEKSFMSTMYVENDYLETHTDNTHNRILSFVYHNTKTWNDNCGGELIFEGGFGQKIIKPSYNTLYLLIPSNKSHHRIKDVKCGKRFSISGWGEITHKGISLKLLEKIRDSKIDKLFKNYFKVM